MNCSLILSSPSSPRPLYVVAASLTSLALKEASNMLRWREQFWVFFNTASTYRLNKLNLELQKPCTKKATTKVVLPQRSQNQSSHK